MDTNTLIECSEELASFQCQLLKHTSLHICVANTFMIIPLSILTTNETCTSTIRTESQHISKKNYYKKMNVHQAC